MWALPLCLPRDLAPGRRDSAGRCLSPPACLHWGPPVGRIRVAPQYLSSQPLTGLKWVQSPCLLYLEALLWASCPRSAPPGRELRPPPRPRRRAFPRAGLWPPLLATPGFPAGTVEMTSREEAAVSLPLLYLGCFCWGSAAGGWAGEDGDSRRKPAEQ